MSKIVTTRKLTNTDYDFQYVQGVLSCPTSVFTDQEAIGGEARVSLRSDCPSR